MKTSRGKFLNLAHYFPYDVKLRLLAHSRSFLANQKAGNAIVGPENLLKRLIQFFKYTTGVLAREYFRSTLPSAYNNWSPWAWDWWPPLNKEQQDATKTEKLARHEASKTADKNQPTVQQSTPNT